MMNQAILEHIRHFTNFAGTINLCVEAQKEVVGGMQVTARDASGNRLYILFTTKNKIAAQGRQCAALTQVEEWIVAQTTARPIQAGPPSTSVYKSDFQTSMQVFDKLQWQYASEIQRVDTHISEELEAFQILRATEKVLIKRTSRKLIVTGRNGPLFAEVDEAVRRDLQEAVQFDPLTRRMKGYYITDPVFHGEGTHFRYRETNMYWEGPNKRALEAFEKASGVPVMSPDEYLSYLQINYPQYYENFEWVTFYRYPKRIFQNGDHSVPPTIVDYRLAVTHLKPIPQIRNSIFDDREAITTATGWYPLVQGSKAWVVRPPYHRLMEKVDASSPISLKLGNLVSLRAINDPTSGNSLLLEGTHGKLLFDTGFYGSPEEIPGLQAVFLSHFHKDHSGGLNQVLARHDVPVILSEPCLSYLWYSDHLSYQAKKKIVNAAHVVDLEQNPISGDCITKFFPIFHAPGSYGMAVADSAGCKVYYLGDVCLKNGFMDPSGEMIANILANEPGKAGKKYVILDATMINKDDYTIAEDDRPNAVIEELLKTELKRDIVFVSDSTETLIYSFVLAFYLTRGEAQTRILLNDDTYTFTRRIIRPVLLKKLEAIDPFVYNLIGDKVVNFIESHRVYPMTSLHYFGKAEHVAIFATSEDVKNDPVLRERVAKSDVAIIGQLALRENIPPEVVSCGPRMTLRVASPDWSFHSDAEDLAAFIRTLNQHQIHTILFHTFPKNVVRFIKEKNLDPTMVLPVSSRGIAL